MSEVRLTVTKDGSHTLQLDALSESYHVNLGAFTESMYVYIEKGLQAKEWGKARLSILEVGFGTGLNVALTLQEAQSCQLEVDFTTLEPYPLTEDVTDKLNYPEFLAPSGAAIFHHLHQSEWEEPQTIADGFTLTKHQQKLQQFSTDKRFDLIYFDAFAPSKQPGLWSLEVMQHCFELLNEGGMLVSYCANGQFKRNLKAAGFTLWQCEGPMGRKEMTRAIKSA